MQPPLNTNYINEQKTHPMAKFANNPFLDDLFELSLHDNQSRENDDLFSSAQPEMVLKFDADDDDEEDEGYNSKTKSYKSKNSSNKLDQYKTSSKKAPSTLSPCSSSSNTTMSPLSSPNSGFIASNPLIDLNITTQSSLDKQLTKFNQDQKYEEDRTQLFLAKVNARITNNMVNSMSANSNVSNPFGFEASMVANTTSTSKSSSIFATDPQMLTS